MRVLQRKCHILSRGGVEPILSAPSLFVLAGPRVADASVMNEQKRVRFLSLTRADFGWRHFKELSSSAGHLCHSVSRLQHSGEVSVLVSVVLVLTLFLCSYFSRFTVRL